MLRYNAVQKTVSQIEEFTEPSDGEILWMNISDDSNLLQDTLDKLDIHPLAKQKIQQFSEIPKVDVYKNVAVISLFALQENLTPLKINILAGKNYVIFLEENKDENFFENLAKTFTEHPDHMSHTGHILYHIIDKISMFYLQSVDKIADEIQLLEKKVFKRPFENEIGKKAYRWKAKLHELRQIVEPQQNVIKSIGKSDFPFINEESGFYFQDLENNYSRIISAFDSFKENLTGIFNLQMSLKADHTNAIIKTLTLVSVVFMPMTFIAGLYGMNFKYMPELSWKFGYGYALILILGIGIGIALYFKQKGWWGKKDSD